MLLSTNKCCKEISSVLVPLQTILGEIQPSGISHWLLQDIDLVSAYLPYGITIPELAIASRADIGVTIDNEEFMRFVSGIKDILQATFIALRENSRTLPVFVLENFDSCEWRVETNDSEIIKRLIFFDWCPCPEVL